MVASALVRTCLVSTSSKWSERQWLLAPPATPSPPSPSTRPSHPAADRGHDATRGPRPGRLASHKCHQDQRQGRLAENPLEGRQDYVTQTMIPNIHVLLLFVNAMEAEASFP